MSTSHLNDAFSTMNDSRATPAARVDAARAVMAQLIDDATGRAVPGPLNAVELAEYNRLTAMIEDVERRRTGVALLRHGLRRNPERQALLDEREQQLYACGSALMAIRAPLHGRFKWPTIYRGVG